MGKRFIVSVVALIAIIGLVLPGCPSEIPIDEFKLTVAATPAGSGAATDVTAKASYKAGESVSIRASAAVGYSFVEWTAPDGTFANAGAAETTFTMPGQDVTLTASFEKELAPYYDFIADQYSTRGLGLFETEVEARFANLRSWFGTYGHFWVAMGPYYLHSLQPVAKFVNLRRFAAYPDDSAKWLQLLDLPIAVQGPIPSRTGAWLDEVIITEEKSSAAAITRLAADDLDIFAFSIGDSTLVTMPAGVTKITSVGSYNEYSFNPVLLQNAGTADEKFNPFGIPEIREAMNIMVDREFIAGSIMGGLAIPRYTAISGPMPDGAIRYPHLIAAIATKYAHTPTNIAAAEAVVEAEMLAAGAFLQGGTWHYDHGANGGVKEIEILNLVRSEDERKQIGAYMGQIFEDLGFKVTELLRTAGEASPLWIGSDPAAGLWTTYTGGWVTTSISLDQGGNFAFFYTDMGLPFPLWQAYVNDPVFYDVADKLDRRDFSTLAQREALFEQALDLHMKDSHRIFLVDREGFTPFRENVNVASDLAGGIYGSWMWPWTAHFHVNGVPQTGGSLRVAMPSILTEPWNPIAGTNWVYDMFPIRATGDMDHQPDTQTGLRWPSRLEKAEVTVQTGLPVGVTNPWVTLSFAPSIAVPGDAWADWNAEEQRFITAAERFPAGTTAMRKSVAYYPKDIFTIPLHDGNTLSFADFLYSAILTFDRAKPDSGIFDPATVTNFNSFMASFKGMKFITNDPNYGLIVEYYSDVWYLDAEIAVTGMFPVYNQGPGVWHTLALAIWAEQGNQLAFSKSKADSLKVEWAHFLAGPSIGTLKSWLDFAP